jgi:hypothetical protein
MTTDPKISLRALYPVSRAAVGNDCATKGTTHHEIPVKGWFLLDSPQKDFYRVAARIRTRRTMYDMVMSKPEME